MTYLIDGLKEIDSVTVYDKEDLRVATCSINVKGISSDQLVSLFDRNGSLCQRWYSLQHSGTRSDRNGINWSSTIELKLQEYRTGD